MSLFLCLVSGKTRTLNFLINNLSLLKSLMRRAYNLFFCWKNSTLATSLQKQNSNSKNVDVKVVKSKGFIVFQFWSTGKDILGLKTRLTQNYRLAGSDAIFVIMFFCWRYLVLHTKRVLNYLKLSVASSNEKGYSTTASDDSVSLNCFLNARFFL